MDLVSMSERCEDSLRATEKIDMIAEFISEIAAEIEYSPLELKAHRQAAAAEETASSKSNAGFYFGMASGVLSVFALSATYVACKSQKKTQDCEEMLL